MPCVQQAMEAQVIPSCEHLLNILGRLPRIQENRHTCKYIKTDKGGDSGRREREGDVGHIWRTACHSKNEMALNLKNHLAHFSCAFIE
jgi:hypothetical protein